MAEDARSLDERTVRTNRALLVLVLLVWSVFVLGYALTDRTSATLASLPALLAAVLALIGGWARPMAIFALSRVAMAATIGSIVALSIVNGGSASIAWWFLAAVPLVAGYAMHPRIRLLWTLAVLIGAALVGLGAPLFGGPPTTLLDVERTLGVSALTLVTLGFATLTQRYADGVIARIAARERTIAEQARELRAAQGELTRARDAALAASRQKSAFLAATSHELRTPLFALLGISDVLASSRLDAEQRDLVETMRSSGRALRALLDEILDLARIEAGRLELSHERLDVHAIVADTVDLFAAPASQRGIAIAGIVDASVPRSLVGDAARVRQVLSNLVGNAVKFTEAGEVVVRARAESVAAGIELTLEVRDTGPGIAEERRARLFTAFEQGGRDVAQRYGGSGLGLAIAQHLARAMGGGIEVESALGVGSAFRARVVLDDATPQVRGSLRGPLAGATLLLIDDHPPSREAAAAMSAELGFTLLAGADAGAVALPERGSWARAVIAVGSSEGRASAVATLRERAPWLRVTLAAWPSELLSARAQASSLGVPTVVLRPLRAERVARVLEEEAPAAQRATDASRPRQPVRVLVVDDDATNRKVAALLLRRLGVDAEAVESGELAIRRVAEAPFDLVLLDLHMPGLDGAETARRIRAALGAGSPLLVAATASVFAEERQRCLDAGMNDVLGKPFEPGALELVVERARAARMRSSAPPPSAVTSVAPPPPAHALDRAKLDELVDLFGGAAEATALVDEFIASASQLMARAREAHARGDHAAAQVAAHTLVSSAGSVGAARVAYAAKMLERTLRAGKPEQASALLTALEEAWAPTPAALRAELAKRA